MSSRVLRTLAVILIGPILLELAACGGNGIKVCNELCCGSDAACPAPLPLLYADGLDGHIAAFPVNPGTGALGTSTTAPSPAQSLGMAALGNQFLYASNSQTALVDAWSITPNTGALAQVNGSPFNLGAFSIAGGLAVNNSAQVLYVADAGRIDALKIDGMGALSPITGSPFSSESSLFLTIDPDTRFVFAADIDPPGAVAAFTIDPSTGALAAVPGSPFPADPGGNVTSPFGLVVDSTGNFVYAVLNTTNQVAAFSIISSSGALNPVPGSPFTAGSRPLSLATTRNLLYVANALDGTVSGYSIDPTTGVLSPLADSPFTIPAPTLTIDPSGRFLYAAGGAGIMVFTIDPTTGALTQISGSPFPAAGATVLTYVQ